MDKNFYYKESFNFTYLLKALDTFTLIFTAFLTYFIILKENIFADRYYQLFLIFSATLSIFIFSVHGLYASWRGRNIFVYLKKIISSWVILVVCLITIAAIFKVSAVYSRVWFAVWSVSYLFTLFVTRTFFVHLIKQLRKKGWNRRNVLIFGVNELAWNVATRLEQTDWTGLEVVGFCKNKDNIFSKIKNKKVFTLENGVEDIVKQNDIHEVWVTVDLKDSEQVKQVMYDLRYTTVNIRFIPDLFQFRVLLNQSITEVAGVATINLTESPMNGTSRVLKEFEDKILAFVILCFISPIMLLICFAIRIESKGPIIFKQRRHGHDGRPINVYKFRSMHVHQENKEKVTQAKRNDSRITKVGGFIRKTSLDELPQFFNVLQGKMSIVGPRPHAIEHNEHYMKLVENYALRHKVKPGITGWAQINGWRGETDTLDKMKKRVEYDIFYIQNWSLIFDLKIIFLTLFKGFVNKNAY